MKVDEEYKVCPYCGGKKGFIYVDMLKAWFYVPCQCQMERLYTMSEKGGVSHEKKGEVVREEFRVQWSG